MKKIIYILALASLTSCRDLPEKHVEEKNYELDFPNKNVELSEYTIDGCEYIGNLSGDTRNCYLAHKGNCSNPIHTK